MPAEPPVELARLAGARRTQLLAGGDGWRPIAGGTDLMVQITGEIGRAAGARARPVAARRAARHHGRRRALLVLGALTTYTDIRRSELCAQHLPALVEAAATIGAAQIQNRGDDRRQHRQRLARRRHAARAARHGRGDRARQSGRASATIAAAEFWPAYRQTARRDDELVLRVRIPLPRGSPGALRKVGTRRAQAISKVVMAVSWRAGWRRVARRPRGAWIQSPPRRSGRARPSASSRARRRAARSPTTPRRRSRPGDQADRRRALHGRLPPGRRGPRAPPPAARGGRLAVTVEAAQPVIVHRDPGA